MKITLLLWLTVLLHIAGENLIAQNQLWLRNITSNIGLDSARGARIVVVDVDNDDYPDLLWGTGGAGKNKYSLYQNIENPDKNSSYRRIYRDITATSGMNINRNTSKTERVIDIASMADVDNDGDMDLVTSIYYHRLEYYKDTLDPGDRSEVYFNDGNGKFTIVPNSGLFDLTVLNWLPKGMINTAGLSFLDYDLDGRIDIYLATWFGDRAQGIGMPDLLLKGNGDGTFTDTKSQIFTSNYYPMYGVNITDWDNDRWPDILTSPYCNSNSNLFRNMQNGSFQDYASQVGFNSTDMTGDNAQALCQWEAQPFDYDNDGDMDILQVFVHGGYDAGEGRTRVLTNMGSDSGYKYKPDLSLLKRDAPANSHLGDQGGQWLDINGDGNADIAIGQMAYPTNNTQGQERLYICLQKPGESPLFQDISKTIGLFSTIKEAHSMEPLDYDLDGDQDLLVSHQVRDTVWKDTTVNGINTRIVVSTSAHMQIAMLENRVSVVDHPGSDYYRWLSVKVNPPSGCNKSGIGTRIKVFANGKSYMQDIQSGLGHFAGQQPFVRNFPLGYEPTNIDSVVVLWPNMTHSTTVVKGLPLNEVVTLDSSGYSGYKKTWDMKKPVIAITNSNLQFGMVNVGQKKELTCDIENLGETALEIVSITSFSSPEFVYVPTLALPITIQPGKKISVTVQFSPTKRAEFIGDLIIRSNAFNDSIAKIHYYAYGFEQKPLIAADKKDIDFGNIFIDSNAYRTIIIRNTGELDLTISQILTNGLPPELRFKNLPAFPVVIKPNQTITLTAEFAPTEVTDYQAIAVVRSNAFNDDSYHINLKGKGELRKPQISVATNTYLFGTIPINSNKIKTVKIKNTGTGELIIKEIDFEKPYQSNYDFQFTLPFTINPGQESELNFNFKPTQIMSYKTNVFVKSNSEKDSVLTLTFIGSGGDVIGNVLDADYDEIFIYPNPAHSYFDVTISDGTSTIENYRLYNLLGVDFNISKMFSNSILNSHRFSVSDLLPGIYILNIRTNNGIYHKTLIIN
jgi:hypothetical protein